MQRTLRYAVTLCLGLCLAVCGQAHQGMWLPSLVKQLNIKDMQAKGGQAVNGGVCAVNRPAGYWLAGRFSLEIAEIA